MFLRFIRCGRCHGKKERPQKSNANQSQRFRKAARELETDDSEEHFDAMVKWVAKSPPPKAAAGRRG
jgi:hypothetical protein